MRPYQAQLISHGDVRETEAMAIRQCRAEVHDRLTEHVVMVLSSYMRRRRQAQEVRP